MVTQPHPNRVSRRVSFPLWTTFVQTTMLLLLLLVTRLFGLVYGQACGVYDDKPWRKNPPSSHVLKTKFQRPSPIYVRQHPLLSYTPIRLQNACSQLRKLASLPRMCPMVNHITPLPRFSGRRAHPGFQQYLSSSRAYS